MPKASKPSPQLNAKTTLPLEPMTVSDRKMLYLTNAAKLSNEWERHLGISQIPQHDAMVG
jgi:hypothetical protein